LIPPEPRFKGPLSVEINGPKTQYLREGNTVSLNSGATFAVGIFNEYQRPLDARTRELLLESAPLSQQWSEQECVRKPKGGMEEWSQDNHPENADNCDCAWYHGTWQYLRLLGMVAVPDWHRSFYTEALWNILRRKPDANVLISAAADYGMLAMLHEAMNLTGSSPRIVVYDICKTPLRSCRWYAERNGISIETKCDNIITSPIPEAPFDLIVTDEFFTVLKAEYKPLISKRWKELLKPGGSVVTAVMMGNTTTPELRRHYAERARQLLAASNGNYLPGTKYRIEAVVDRCVAFSELHTRHMVTSESEVHSLFSSFDNVTCRRITTPGECVNPTDSFQIVASSLGPSLAEGTLK
jgi:2-polyprenyl-3-methyl-5-hydroxy-6-metoxy-1,4-benzoquinol methylase